MGLKLFVEGDIKAGKTFFALSLAEGGPIGYIDTEQRTQMYTRPIEEAEAIAKCPWLAQATGLDGNLALFNGRLRPPFENPRVWRDDLPSVRANSELQAVVKPAHTIFIVEAMDPTTVRAVMETFGRAKGLFGFAWDTMTDTWDLTTELKDPNPKKDRLGWEAPRRLNRHLLYAGRTQAHVIITSHLKIQWEKQGSELVKIGMTAAVQPASPRWADLHLRLVQTEPTEEQVYPAPNVIVRGEGTGGKIPLGAVMTNATFGKVLRALDYIPTTTGGALLDPKEAEYRTIRALQAAGNMPDGPDPSNPAYSGESK